MPKPKPAAPPPVVSAATAAAVAPAPRLPELDPGANRRHASPSIARTLPFILKLSVSAAIIIGITYATIHTIVPAVKELAHPANPAARPDKNAPAFVQAIQQTRHVVAKNDANVAHLNTIVDLAGAAAPAGPPAPFVPLGARGPSQSASAAASSPASALDAPPAPLPVKASPAAPVRVSTYAPNSQPVEITASQSAASKTSKSSLRLFTNAVADLKISGVNGGSAPRILVDGLLVKVGGVADYRLKLKFAGMDQVKRVLIFTNDAGDTFMRPY